MEPWNLIGWILRCLQPYWLNSPMLTTLLVEFSDAYNPIGWILRCLQPYWLNSPMLTTLLVEFSDAYNPIGWILRCLQPYWLNSPMLTTLLVEFSDAYNPIGWILRCLQPYWLNSPMLTTLLVEFSDAYNPIGWILRCLQPYWLNSPMLTTLLVEFSVSKNLIGCVVHAKNTSYVFLTFDPDASRQTDTQTIFSSSDPPYSRGNLSKTLKYQFYEKELSESIDERYLFDKWIISLKNKIENRFYIQKQIVDKKIVFPKTIATRTFVNNTRSLKMTSSSNQGEEHEYLLWSGYSLLVCGLVRWHVFLSFLFFSFVVFHSIPVRRIYIYIKLFSRIKSVWRVNAAIGISNYTSNIILSLVESYKNEGRKRRCPSHSLVRFSLKGKISLMNIN